MKITSLKLTLSALTLLMGIGLMAQKGSGKDRRAMIQEKKMTYCNEQVGLTEGEAEKYWAIDAELMEERNAIRKEVKKVRDIDFENATDAEIESAIKKGLGLKVTVAELDLEYVDRFLEVVSPKQLALMKKSREKFQKEVLRDLKGEGRPGRPGDREK